MSPAEFEELGDDLLSYSPSFFEIYLTRSTMHLATIRGGEIIPDYKHITVAYKTEDLDSRGPEIDRCQKEQAAQGIQVQLIVTQALKIPVWDSNIIVLEVGGHLVSYLAVVRLSIS